MNGIVINYKSMATAIEKELTAAAKRNRRKAATIAKRKLRDAAPVDSGDLRSSIKDINSDSSSYVGFTRPKGAHAWLVENGHDIIKNGVKVGHAEGKPFFAPTWDGMLPELQAIMQEPL